MDRNKTLLYVLAGAVWFGIVLATFMNDHSNDPSYDGYVSESPEEVLLGEYTSISYSNTSGGDTQVVFEKNYKKTYVQVQGEVSGHSVFPAGKEQVGISFKHTSKLDTVVIFGNNDSKVFYNVLALDSSHEKIAFIEGEKEDHSASIVITTFEQVEIARAELKNHPSAFADKSTITSAEFKDSGFKMVTPFGAVLLPLLSLI